MNEHKLLFSTLHRLELSDKKDKNALDDKTIDELILDGIVIAYFNNNRFLLFINDIKKQGLNYSARVGVNSSNGNALSEWAEATTITEAVKKSIDLLTNAKNVKPED